MQSCIFLKKCLIFDASIFLISLFKALYISESLTGCSYVFWALFSVSRYEISCCDRLIGKKENSQSISLPFLFSWSHFSDSADSLKNMLKEIVAVSQLRNTDFSLAETCAVDSFPTCVWCKDVCLSCDLLLEDKRRTQIPHWHLQSWKPVNSYFLSKTLLCVTFWKCFRYKLKLG